MLQKKIDFGKRMIEKWAQFYDGEEGRAPLQLANSGGKDSLVIYTLAKEVGISFPVIHTNTTIDPDGTLKYIREFMPETNIIHPKESFYQLVSRKMLPVAQNRYCCEYLKEYAGKGMATIEGVRAAESSKRKGRDIECCDTRKSMQGAKHLYPIYDWSDDEVWSFIRQRGLEVAPCYHKGLCRLGCVGCPQVTRKGAREHEFELYPRRWDAVKRAIQKGMDNNPHWRISRYTGCDGEKAMHWWLSNKPMYKYFGYEIPLIKKYKKD